MIIAAGQGSRLQGRHHIKPLIPLLGKPLIEHVMTSAMAGGVSDFVVVTGYHGAELRDRLDAFSHRCHTPVRHVRNEAWDRPNGLSVLAARDAIDGAFFLLMSDHLFEPGILIDMAAEGEIPDGVMLGVDFEIHDTTVDMDDVTRVDSENGRIRKLGKGLTPFNGFDTGIFLCSPAIFTAIEESLDTTDDASLTGGMNVLAASNKAKAFDVSGRFWLDVDDPRSADLAEQTLRDRVMHSQ